MLMHRAMPITVLSPRLHVRTGVFFLLVWRIGIIGQIACRLTCFCFTLIERPCFVWVVCFTIFTGISHALETSQVMCNPILKFAYCCLHPLVRLNLRLIRVICLGFFAQLVYMNFSCRLNG